MDVDLDTIEALLDAKKPTQLEEKVCVEFCNILFSPDLFFFIAFYQKAPPPSESKPASTTTNG